jgi:uncharacterized protein (DUF433 family)
MAHDVSRQRERELQEARALAGQSARNGVSVSANSVLALISGGADADAVLRAYPGLTREDLRAVLADTLMRDDPLVGDGGTGFVSPQAFYREAVQREDVRRILAALAK